MVKYRRSEEYIKKQKKRVDKWKKQMKSLFTPSGTGFVTWRGLHRD